MLLVAALLLQGVLAMTSGIDRALDHVNPVNKNRLIASYTDEECWYLFRLRKDQLIDFFARLNLPANITCDNDIICPAEHACLLYMYHLSCPSIFLRLQNESIVLVAGSM